MLKQASNDGCLGVGKATLAAEAGFGCQGRQQAQQGGQALSSQMRVQLTVEVPICIVLCLVSPREVGRAAQTRACFDTVCTSALQRCG